MKLSHFFNGDGVQIIHIPAAHTDGDTIVYFRRSDVIATGDIFDMTRYPVIDIEQGRQHQRRHRRAEPRARPGDSRVPDGGRAR